MKFTLNYRRVTQKRLKEVLSKREWEIVRDMHYYASYIRIRRQRVLHVRKIGW